MHFVNVFSRTPCTLEPYNSEQEEHLTQVSNNNKSNALIIFKSEIVFKWNQNYDTVFITQISVAERSGNPQKCTQGPSVAEDTQKSMLFNRRQHRFFVKQLKLS